MNADAARHALAAWDMAGAELSLAAQRENIVFRVTHDGMQYALRLHRPGYQSKQMVQSELDWIRYLCACGLTVPTPLPTRTGSVLVKVGEHFADMLTWLKGKPMGATGQPLRLADRTGTFRKIGTLMAKVHRISDEWTPPDRFLRQSWDIEGLLGDRPLWGHFWENPGLGEIDRKAILRARDLLRQDLQDADLDFGLIHADMLRENVMIDGPNIGLIDFDDSGYGFRLFDVATTLLKNRAEPDFEDLTSAFMDGYRQQRALDFDLLPQFMLVRALTYLGWIIPRLKEPGADTRQARFLAECGQLVHAYLQGRPNTV